MTLKPFLVSIAVTGLLASCSAQTSDENQSVSQREQSATPAKPGADSAKPVVPEWVSSSRGWPDTIRWAFDSTFELTTDGLLVRIRPEVGLDLTGLNFPGQEPMISRVMVTMRPVVEWGHARGFKLDSLVVFDRIKKRYLPGQPLLSFERSYTDNTVRTLFLPNMAIIQEPEFAEGQPVGATIFMTWDDRTIIGTFPILTTKYLRGTGEW